MIEHGEAPDLPSRREDWDLPAAFRAIEGAVPWGDWDYRFPDMEVALRLLLEATRDDLLRYDEELEEDVLARWGGDEFSVPPELVAALRPEHKLAYLARLIETLALSYGVTLDANGGGLVSLSGDETSPAGLLRGLYDESWWLARNTE